MSADPTLDFLSSGGGSVPATSGDPTHDFLASGGDMEPVKPAAPVDINKEDLPEILWQGSKQLAGGIAHGVGTLVDVATGTSPGEGSHAERYAAPFAAPPSIQDIDQARDLQKVTGAVSKGYDATFGTGPAATTFKERIPQAVEAASTAASLISAGGNLVNSVANRVGKVGPSGALQDMRDAVGPDVTTTNPVEHGETLISAYKAKDAAAQADIAAKYKALTEANGGQFPVDAKALLDNATEQLHSKLLFDHAPAPVMRTLQRLADNDNMTFENFEALRTNLASLQRSTTDANEARAAGVIRGAMEDLPLAPGAAELKGLADKARAAAKAQFQALEGDPAYNAAVNDKVSADKFVQKYVIGGDKANLATMQRNLSDNPVARQTIGVSAIDHLRTSSGVDAFGNGNFSSNGFNRAWRGLSPKRDLLFEDPTAPQYLDALGGVAAQKAPGLVGKAASHVADVAEGAVNYAAHGVPVGSIARGAIRKVLPSGPRVAPYQPPPTLSGLAGSE